MDQLKYHIAQCIHDSLKSVKKRTYNFISVNIQIVLLAGIICFK